MCGFAGFVGEVENREKVLVDMMNTIIHRGPDSEGKFVDGDAALGFRRLSIIDLSEVGDQPLYNEDKSKVLVFNGEIYNYQELRKELAEAGHVFVSNTDSETLLHGYEEWGGKAFGPSAWHVCLCDLGQKKEASVCGQRYFRDQAPLLCTDERDAAVRFGDQVLSGTSAV